MERSLERSSSSGMAFVSRGGATHKAITLDLMLRTFMNSPDFQPQNPRMWEGIARLVPGTTPQQVCRQAQYKLMKMGVNIIIIIIIVIIVCTKMGRIT